MFNPVFGYIKVQADKITYQIGENSQEYTVKNVYLMKHPWILVTYINNRGTLVSAMLTVSMLNWVLIQDYDEDMAATEALAKYFEEHLVLSHEKYYYHYEFGSVMFCYDCRSGECRAH